MKIELLSHTPDPEKVIEIAGRNCYQSKVGDNTIIQRWIKVEHFSLLEHASATFRLSGVSRSLMAQITRHRIGASFAIKSQRYVNENDFDYATPTKIINNEQQKEVFESTMLLINIAYKRLIELGAKKEDARAVLPNATATEIVTTMNFRELRSFFKLRISKHAQKEIRDVAIEMLFQVVKIAPNVFQDVVDNYIKEDF